MDNVVAELRTVPYPRIPISHIVTLQSTEHFSGTPVKESRRSQDPFALEQNALASMELLGFPLSEQELLMEFMDGEFELADELEDVDDDELEKRKQLGQLLWDAAHEPQFQRQVARLRAAERDRRIGRLLADGFPEFLALQPDVFVQFAMWLSSAAASALVGLGLEGAITHVLEKKSPIADDRITEDVQRSMRKVARSAIARESKQGFEAIDSMRVLHEGATTQDYVLAVTDRGVVYEAVVRSIDDRLHVVSLHKTLLKYYRPGEYFAQR